ncbi:hypothetical protein RO3G_14744 [Rhizopus delemar RA 99-880]|uniref:Uncharacterized protein n=1 Tax=Rhizopus delemar (strain RA 99-880 / ATCC MYA-4621 / FGSC 9543 / NRRL 43880) TaxID=246409 RepID=I1CNK3_RHIO9|nr:hypothetical protein RO3G_14744 [Rhizopus delemar RA 99-880]|eukprot:EIE90033.1 hypothetical protein RO3G_14744 [Rhizopus delemar RA 99-880]
MRHRLQIAASVLDLLPFLLNQLPKETLLSPKKTITWTAQWLIICILQHELNYLVHEEILTIPLEHGIQLFKWLSQNQFQVLQCIAYSHFPCYTTYGFSTTELHKRQAMFCVAQ